MRYVSYTRTASCFEFDEIPSDVIMQQNDHIQNYARDHHFTISAKYSDRKKDAEEKTGFENLLADGMMRKFDFVVVDSIFRCGDSLWRAKEVMLQTFFYAGIHFIVVEDDFDSSKLEPEAVEQYFKEKYSFFKARVLGHRNQQRQGTGILTWNDTKYGYRLTESGVLEIDDTYADVIRYIVNALIEGKSNNEIAENLTLNKVTTPLGVKLRDADRCNWNPNTISKLLLGRTVYIGYWEKTVSGKKIKLSNAPILTEEEYYAVQEILEPRKEVRYISAHTQSFLKGLVYDAETGCKMNLRKDRNGLGVFCVVDLGEGHSISVPIIEKAVLEKLQVERTLAERVLLIMGKNESSIILENCIQAVGEEMKPVFHEIASKMAVNLQSADDRARQFELVADCEKYFSEKMKMIADLKLAYSSRNPWVKGMMELGVVNSFDCGNAKKIVKYVLLHDYATVEVVTQWDEWKQLLPKEWLEES